MKKLIYSVIVPLFIVILYSGCAESVESQKKQCVEQGLKYKSEKRLNFRTGEYEIKLICFNSYSK